MFARQAWEFDVPLRVVALRGSVPSQWAADFRTAAGSRGQLKLQQRSQLQAIYDELSKGRWFPLACSRCLHVAAQAFLNQGLPCATVSVTGLVATPACTVAVSPQAPCAQGTSTFATVTLGCRKKDLASTADAVTLSDSWLAPAIQAGLVRPVPKATSSRWWVRLS